MAKIDSSDEKSGRSGCPENELKLPEPSPPKNKKAKLKPKPKRQNQGSQDSAWKDIIPAHFEAFMRFYFPKAAAEIDFTKPITLKDKELRKLTAADSSPHRHADLLIQVHTKSAAQPATPSTTPPANKPAPSNTGSTALLYAYIEVQGKPEKEYPKRVFTCAARVFNAYGELPFILLLLTDTNPGFTPTCYEFKTPGRNWRIEFETAKLLWYNERRAELEESRDIFAYVTLAQLELNDAKKSARRRKGKPQPTGDNGPGSPWDELYEFKKRVIVKLLRKNFSRRDVRSLLIFLDWSVQLPAPLEEQLTDEIEEETGGGTMPYVTSWERIAEEKGKPIWINEGKLEDKREVLARQLDKKFNLTDEERELISKHNDPQQLDEALDAIVFAQTKEEVLELLR